MTCSLQSLRTGFSFLTPSSTSGYPTIKTTGRTLHCCLLLFVIEKFVYFGLQPHFFLLPSFGLPTLEPFCLGFGWWVVVTHCLKQEKESPSGKLGLWIILTLLWYLIGRVQYEHLLNHSIGIFLR